MKTCVLHRNAPSAIRHFKSQGGVNITASHNPREYNGYKAYWEDGAQVLPPHDKGIIDEVNKVTIDDVKFEGNKALIQLIGEDVDKIYLDKVHTLSIDPEVIKRQHDLCIVYTPLHGTGMTVIPRSLELWGFDNVHCVKEQMVKDGNFSTVDRPNPEFAEALTLGLRDAKALMPTSLWHLTLMLTALVWHARTTRVSGRLSTATRPA